jgi:hypothetical protein
MIKALKKQGMFLNIIKSIYNKPRDNIILNGEQLIPFLLCSFGIPSQSNKTRARNKKDSNREGRSHTIPICRGHDPIPKRL